MLTLNQLKDKLVNFFIAHKQVNSVYYGSNFSFNSKRDLLYPVAHIEWNDSNIRGKETIHNYSITIADLVHPEKEAFEDEIYSDAVSIIEDFYASLQYDADVFLIKTSSLQPFSDAYGDRISGVTFRASISLIRSQNECVIPS